MLCCSVGYKWITVINGFKFEFNDIISLCMNNGSEQRRFVSLGYFMLLYLGTVETRLVITVKTGTMMVNQISSLQKISHKHIYFTTCVTKIIQHRY